MVIGHLGEFLSYITIINGLLKDYALYGNGKKKDFIPHVAQVDFFFFNMHYIHTRNVIFISS